MFFKLAYHPKRQVCIYVVAEEGSPAVAKIGITELLARRLGSMQTNNWRKLTIPAAYAIETWEQAQEIECLLLTKLSTSIIRGEWFALSPSTLQAYIEEQLQLLEIPVIDLIKNQVETNVINIARRC